MIYLIHGLHLFETFLNIKTENQYKNNFKHSFNDEISKYNQQKLKQKLETNNTNEDLLKIDTSLLNESIDSLLQKVNINLFQEYVSLTQIVFVTSKNSSNPVLKKGLFLFSSMKVFSFESNDHEIDQVLCAKRKRGDEGLKHCFKAIRKGIINSYKKNTDHTNNLSTLKEEYLTNIFEQNDEMKKHFRENNITKKTISTLKSNAKFIKESEEYKNKNFLKDQVKRNILEKNEEILTDSLSFESFAKVLLDKQKKHGWILQNIINSIETYDACTVDIKQRKRKTKKKKIKEE